MPHAVPLVIAAVGASSRPLHLFDIYIVIAAASASL